MNLKFSNCKISGQLLIVPQNERTFIDDMKKFNFSEARSLKLKNVMGYDRHRIVTDGVCVSDLVVSGFEYLFSNNLLSRNDLDIMILVSSSPDHFLPPTSSIVHGRLGLKKDMLCLDVNQGCCGFIVGLIQAFSLINQSSVKKIAVVTADVLSRKVSIKDRNSYPLVGDAASITIMEKSDAAENIFASINVDGSRNEALIIPAGGFKMPCTAETGIMKDAGDNNFRSQDDLVMDGTAVFNFVMEDVPPMIKDLFETAGISDDDIDYYLFHQPNRFMLEKLADAIGVSHEKVPSNVVQVYGNSSSTTIPAVIALNLSETVCKKTLNVCFSGFGVGLTWGAILMKLGTMEFCKTIEFPVQKNRGGNDE